jgi:hypothetical protein
MGWYGLDLFRSEQGPVKGSCELAMKFKVSQNVGSFLSN